MEHTYIVGHQKLTRNNVIIPWDWEARMMGGHKAVLDYVRELQKGVASGSVKDVTIRRYNAATGKTILMEPYLRGFDVELREVAPMPPQSTMHEQRQ